MISEIVPIPEDRKKIKKIKRGFSNKNGTMIQFWSIKALEKLVFEFQDRLACTSLQSAAST